jgi:hypothetical protein
MDGASESTRMCAFSRQSTSGPGPISDRRVGVGMGINLHGALFDGNFPRTVVGLRGNDDGRNIPRHIDACAAGTTLDSGLRRNDDGELRPTTSWIPAFAGMTTNTATHRETSLELKGQEPLALCGTLSAMDGASCIDRTHGLQRQHKDVRFLPAKCDRVRRGTREGDGAGEGNRTLVVSLGSFLSTIEIHPHRARHCARAPPFQASRGRNNVTAPAPFT